MSKFIQKSLFENLYTNINFKEERIEKENMTKRIKEDGIVFSELEIAQIMVYFTIKQIKNICKSKNKIRILEPSVGDGSLIVELLKHIPNTINVIVDCLDIHQDFINNTKNNIQFSSNIQVNYILQDYLTYHPKYSYDVIISNPPYVRTSVIGADKSQELKKNFQLSGKIDLYQAFFIKMINELNEDGIISIITSNKYLYNKSGTSLRKYILKHLSIDYILDLGDTKLFNAAVLPAILVGKKNLSVKNGLNKFISIYENHNSDNLAKSNEYKSIFDYISSNKKEKYFTYKNSQFIVKSGNICFQTKDILLLEHNDKIFVNKIDSVSKYKLKELADVKVGIKSTADKVFIHQQTFRDVEDELIHPIIVSKSINKWKINPSKQKTIIYPYNYSINDKEVIDLKQFPKCEMFFNSNQETLTKRTYVMKSSKQWFEIWVPHSPKIWKTEKIVFKDISSHGVFAYDNGSIVNGDSFFILLKNNVDKDYLFLLLGILNSDLMYKYHQIMFPNKLYSNKNRFNSQYVEKYPIPDISSPIAQSIISLVKELLFSDCDISNEEIKLNKLCNQLYQLN